jgi:hypothetical protein
MSTGDTTPWNEWILPYYEQIRADWSVPEDIEVLDPYGEDDIRQVRQQFYDTYYNDSQPRQLWLGINPGRLGAGRTGIPFSDAVQLERYCGIEAPGPQTEELSAAFIFEVIQAAGGAESFYQRVFIDSVSPMGYVRAGVNCNYYDQKDLFEGLRPRLERHIGELVQRPGPDEIILLGKGKNLKYFRQLYSGHHRVIALPHPRWVMQYRRKDKARWIDRYLEVLPGE